MKEISGNSINEVVYDSCLDLHTYGEEKNSRWGSMKEVLNRDLVLTNPTNRHLNLPGRYNNIFGVLGEMFWVMSGGYNIDPVLSYFVPRAKDFSDDGKTWSDSYGERLYKHGQIDNLVRTFCLEGKTTRRGIISIYLPELDSLRPVRGDGKIRSIPCNDTCFYYIRDNKFYSKVVQRSADLIWGTSAANLPEFTFMQEIFLGLLKNNSEDFKDVSLGSHTQSIVSLHSYLPGSGAQVNKILESVHIQDDLHNFKLSLGSQIKCQSELLGFFKSVLGYFHFLIEKDSGSRIPFLENLFSYFMVPTEENSLYSYAKLCERYITSRKDKAQLLDSEDWDSILSSDLLEAVRCSKFLPVGVK